METTLDEARFDATRVARFLRAPDGSLRVAVVNTATGAELGTFPIVDRTREGMARVMEAVASVRSAIERAAEAPPAVAAVGPSTADLIISHDAESGTTIRTRVPEDRRFSEAIRDLGRGFKWLRSERHWYRQQSIGTAKPTLNLEMAADNLRAKGATVYVEPVEEVSELEAAKVKRAHLQDRAGRYYDRSKKHAEVGSALLSGARAMSDRIPVGQPIHVGHHSEGSDRSFREKIRRKTIKGLEEQDEADRLRATSDALDAAADRYTPEAIAAVHDHNDFVNALLAIITKRLKADVGASRISTQRGAAKAESATVTVSYPADSPPWHAVEIERGGAVTVRRQMNLQGRVPVRMEGDSPEEVYARILEALPRASAANTSELVAEADPARFAHELAAYGMRRLKRSVGAQEVRQRGIEESDDMNAKRVPMLVASWSNGRVHEWWEIYVIGTKLRVRFSRSYSVTTYDKGVILEADVSRVTVPKAYEMAVKAINEARPNLPAVVAPW